MIKSKIFSKIKDVFSEYLYGFSEDKFEVGLLTGTVELKNLIVKPAAVNGPLQASNSPILLKAGLISCIKVQVRLLGAPL